MPPVRAAVAQAGSILFDSGATLAKAERPIAEAAASGARLGLVIGAIERDGGTLYGTALFFAPDGANHGLGNDL